MVEKGAKTNKKAWKTEYLILERRTEDYKKEISDLKQQLEQGRDKFYNTDGKKPEVLKKVDDKPPIEQKTTPEPEKKQEEKKNILKIEKPEEEPEPEQKQKPAETEKKYQCPECNSQFDELNNGCCPNCEAELENADTN